jgi:sulfate adenylyltransferase subunit 2
MTNKDRISEFLSSNALTSVLTVKVIAEALYQKCDAAAIKAAERQINKSPLRFNPLKETSLLDEHGRLAKRLVLGQLLDFARKKRKLILFTHILSSDTKSNFLVCNDARGGRRWVRIYLNEDPINALQAALIKLCEFEKKDIVMIPSGLVVEILRKLVKKQRSQRVVKLSHGSITISLEVYSHGKVDILQSISPQKNVIIKNGITHLDRLEAEAIHIFREVMAEADNPVMLYSVGKDSSVLLHLAQKAFFPSPPPFPLLHIDTRWKFQAMYDFRDYTTQISGMELLVHINPQGEAKNINPFDHGSALHTDIMKTQSLKMAIDHYNFDVAFGGARRDEEKSRAKERVFSFRTPSHQWDPKNQRPELWNLYNGKKNRGESIRVFPISNWTELDIWQYIYREQIPIVPLYFASERPVIEREGMLIMVDDDRLPLYNDETIQLKKIRFRTLGCYPLTGAIESEADDLAGVIMELLSTRTSERKGRTIDRDTSASMEKKKQEGYF